MCAVTVQSIRVEHFLTAHTCLNSPTSFPKSTEEAYFAVCADRWENDADYRKCMHENSRTCETMESWDQVANRPQKIHKNDPAAKAGELWKSVVHCSEHSQRIQYLRVNILNLDKLTALAWIATPRTFLPLPKQYVPLHKHNNHDCRTRYRTLQTGREV